LDGSHLPHMAGYLACGTYVEVSWRYLIGCLGPWATLWGLVLGWGELWAHGFPTWRPSAHLILRILTCVWDFIGYFPHSLPCQSIMETTHAPYFMDLHLGWLLLVDSGGVCPTCTHDSSSSSWLGDSAKLWRALGGHLWHHQTHPLENTCWCGQGTLLEGPSFCYLLYFGGTCILLLFLVVGCFPSLD